MRWVRKTSSTTWALAASAASASPRRYSRHREGVGVGAPDRELGVVEGGDGIGQRPQHAVRRRRPARPRRAPAAAVSATTMARTSPGVGRAAALGDHDRPVGVDDADPQRAGDVRRGVDGDDAGRGARRLDVDAVDVGAGVVGQAERGVEQPGHAEVVDVAPIAQREGRRLVPGAARADAARLLGHQLLAGGDGLDGVEDLHVAGAAAEVGAEVAGHVLAGEVGTLLVDLGLGPHDDAGDAEAALQAAAGRERVGVAGPLVGVEALQGDDGPALDLGRAAAGRRRWPGRRRGRCSSRTGPTASSRPWAR